MTEREHLQRIIEAIETAAVRRAELRKTNEDDVAGVRRAAGAANDAWRRICDHAAEAHEFLARNPTTP